MSEKELELFSEIKLVLLKLSYTKLMLLKLVKALLFSKLKLELLNNTLKSSLWMVENVTSPEEESNKSTEAIMYLLKNGLKLTNDLFIYKTIIINSNFFYFFILNLN